MPNQPKTKNRTMRIDDPEWEGFAVLSEAHGTDRTKELVRILGWFFYAPGVEPPQRVKPSVLISGMREAAQEADRAAEVAKTPEEREKLAEKAQALRDMAATIQERAEAQGLLDS